MVRAVGYIVAACLLTVYLQYSAAARPATNQRRPRGRSSFLCGRGLIFRACRALEGRWRGILSNAFPAVLHVPFAQVRDRYAQRLSVGGAGTERSVAEVDGLAVPTLSGYDRVVVVADMHLRGEVAAGDTEAEGSRMQVVRTEALASLERRVRPGDLVLCLGDLFELGDFTAALRASGAEAAGRPALAAFVDTVSGYFRPLAFLTGRCAMVPGNHDLSRRGLGLGRDWDVFAALRASLSPPQLAGQSASRDQVFNVGNLTLALLDTNAPGPGAAGSVDEAGLETVRRAVAAAAQGGQGDVRKRTLVVAMHHSPFKEGAMSQMSDRAGLCAELERCAAESGVRLVVLAGHSHTTSTRVSGPVSYVVLGSSEVQLSLATVSAISGQVAHPGEGDRTR